MAKKSNKESKHYVNNAEFLEAIKTYKQQKADAEAQGKPEPRIPNYVGDCILKIATHLSYKPNFINYTYRDEMISDGIENCLMYFNNFDPEKSKNPFAYFTQIIYYAFVRRIQKEKKQTLIKGKIVQEMPFEMFELQDHDEDGEFTNSYLQFVRENGVYDDILAKDKADQEAKKAKRERKKQATLDDIIEDEEQESDDAE